MTTNQYLYFFSGPFSNWHKSNFVIDEISFNTVEQYIMYNKALLFADKDIANQILKSSNPKECKALGRKVKNFDMIYWNEHCIQLMFRGCHAKFSQNTRLYNMLMNTDPATLVEASQFDQIWGNGLSEEDSKKIDPSKWPGKNWLGLTLTNLREYFTEEERIEREYKNGRT